MRVVRVWVKGGEGEWAVRAGMRGWVGGERGVIGWGDRVG